MAQHGISSTSTTATAVLAPNSSSGAQQPYQAHVPHDSALSVGSSKAEEDAAKIRDLEDEVRVLAERANSASQRFADYENEIRVLEAKLRQEQRKNSAPATATATPKIDAPDSPATASPTTPQDRPGISRFGSFIGSRNKTTPAQQNGALVPPPNGSREKELEEKLIQEQTTRIAAEKKVKEVNAEIEDLSATLFQQANEMVATERKEKAELEERNRGLRVQLERLEAEQKDVVEQRRKDDEERQREMTGIDEKQAAVARAQDERLAKENERLKEKLRRLEQREGERKKRLERLEAASKRVERVKAMLQPP